MATPSSKRRVARRALLGGGLAIVAAGGSGVGLVEGGYVPGRGVLNRRLGLHPPAASVPAPGGGELRSGSFRSDARGGVRTGWTVGWPAGHAPGSALPVLIVLHGFGGTHETAFRDLFFDRHLAAVVAAGSRPFAVASVDGGDGYWHQRRGFGDSGRMVVEEFVPRLTELGLRAERYGLLGWSMGGYGALLLGQRLGPEVVPVLVAESPALWTSVEKRNPTAFDDAADYRAHDVWAGRSKLTRTAVRIDCGTDDAFCPAARRYAGGLDPEPAGDFVAGNHDDDFWIRMAPRQLAFVAERLG